MKTTQGQTTSLMPASASGDLAEKLRNAIRSEAYEEALVLLPAYVCQVEQAASLDYGQPDQAETLVHEAHQLLHWVRRTVSANRAHIQAKLNQLGRADRYQRASVSGAGAYLFQA